MRKTKRKANIEQYELPLKLGKADGKKGGESMGNDPKTVRFAPKETLVVMKGKLPLDYLTGECHHFSEGVWFGELRNKRPFGKGIFAYKDGRVKSGQVEGGRFVGEPLNEVQRKVFHSRSQELLIKSVTRKPSRTLEIKC